jgi:hypothetical protein
LVVLVEDCRSSADCMIILSDYPTEYIFRNAIWCHDLANLSGIKIQIRAGCIRAKLNPSRSHRLTSLGTVAKITGASNTKDEERRVHTAFLAGGVNKMTMIRYRNLSISFQNMGI